MTVVVADVLRLLLAVEPVAVGVLLRFILAMSSPKTSPVRNAEIRSSNSPATLTHTHFILKVIDSPRTAK
jgi:hypothetical protein